MDAKNGTEDKSKAGESPSCWSSPPKCIINLAEFLERAKSYAHLVVDGGLLEDPQELKKIDKRIVSVFVVDKRTRKICRSTKNTVLKALESFGFKPLRIVKGAKFFMWDVLLPTSEDCVAAASRELINKEIILRTEYEGRRKTRVTVYEVPPQVIGEQNGRA